MTLTAVTSSYTKWLTQPLSLVGVVLFWQPHYCQPHLFITGSLQLKPLSFEKDDDSNGHIDFITAASVGILQLLYCTLIKLVK